MRSFSAASGISRKPPWLHVKLPAGERTRFLKTTLDRLGLHTVCEEARCPNLGECWGGGTATFMILGDVCTRGCRFCAVKTGKYGSAVDPLEPEKVAAAAAAMGLDYAVITGVDRDDLPDQGAGHFARVVRTLKEKTGMLVEVLIPDFRGDWQALEALVRSRPDCIAHNLETVRRLSPKVRDRRAGYDQSLFVLESIKKIDPGMPTKSSLMLGLGESRQEILVAFEDLRRKNVDFLTLGQYLKPGGKHLEVERYVTPGEFEELGSLARSCGFGFVASGPLVRSSYRAGEFFIKNLRTRKGAFKENACSQ